MNLTGYLDVLLIWSSMFERVLEKFESKQYANYTSFARSEALGTAMASIIGLTANHHMNQMQV